MLFLDSWTQLPAHLLVRWVLPVGFLVVLVGMPGRVVARVGSVGVALALGLSPELVVPGGLRAGWIALWLLIAWGIGGAPSLRARVSLERRLGFLETGTVGLVLGWSATGFAALAGAATLDDRPALGAGCAGETGVSAPVGSVAVGSVAVRLRRSWCNARRSRVRTVWAVVPISCAVIDRASSW